jgi:hypothetical protein
MDPDEPSVVDEAPARSLDVPARAVRPGRGRRAGFAVVVFGASVVLAGFTSRLFDGRPRLAADVVAATSPAVRSAPPLSATPIAGTLLAENRGPRPAFGWAVGMPAGGRPVQVIDLTSPGPGSIIIAPNRLTVAGTLLVRAARVEIVLSANGNRMFGRASLDVSDRDGGIRPDQPPAFTVPFDLATPRPMGTMLVVVTAFDAADEPLGALSRAVSIEPLGGG